MSTLTTSDDGIAGHIHSADDLTARLKDIQSIDSSFKLQRQQNGSVKSGWPPDTSPMYPELRDGQPLNSASLSGVYSNGRITQKVGEELGPAAPELKISSIFDASAQASSPSLQANILPEPETPQTNVDTPLKL